jgi:hypothetical protein
MVDDLSLDAVSWAHHASAQRLASVPVLGLDGDVQQRLGRASHEIELAGVISGDSAKDDLEKLQKKCAAGDEVPFTADITTALEIKKVVIVRAEFEEAAGVPGIYHYRLLLRESPPLPPPAELAPFGGLGGFDLGFDTDVLGDIAGLADQVQGAVEAVSGALSDLQKLASLGDLGLGNPLSPIQDETGKLSSVGTASEAAGKALKTILGDG